MLKKRGVDVQKACCFPKTLRRISQEVDREEGQLEWPIVVEFDDKNDGIIRFELEGREDADFEVCGLEMQLLLRSMLVRGVGRWWGHQCCFSLSRSHLDKFFGTQKRSVCVVGAEIQKVELFSLKICISITTTHIGVIRKSIGAAVTGLSVKNTAEKRGDQLGGGEIPEGGQLVERGATNCSVPLVHLGRFWQLPVIIRGLLSRE